MRRGWVVAGAVVAAIGALIVLAGFLVNDQTESWSVPAGSARTLTPMSLTPVTATIRWSGGNATTEVWLVSGPATCVAPTGVAAIGKGPSGSISPTLSPGTTYSLYACSGTAAQNGTFAVSWTGGVTVLEVVGLVAIVLGAALVVLGLRARGPRRLEALVAGSDRPPAGYPGGKGTPPPDLGSRPTLPPAPAHEPPAGRTMQGCPSCGKVFPTGPYAACPSCGHPF